MVYYCQWYCESIQVSASWAMPLLNQIFVWFVLMHLFWMLWISWGKIIGFAWVRCMVFSKAFCNSTLLLLLSALKSCILLDAIRTTQNLFMVLGERWWCYLAVMIFFYWNILLFSSKNTLRVMHKLVSL